jgi:pyrroline-5-carboxylate reductase
LGEKVLADVMVQEATGFGIEASVARKLADTTISGTRRILATNFDVKILIQRVSSKGGTTEAGMKVLEQMGKTKEALSEAIRAACRRAEELSKQ